MVNGSIDKRAINRAQRLTASKELEPLVNGSIDKRAINRAQRLTASKELELPGGVMISDKTNCAQRLTASKELELRLLERHPRAGL